MPACDLHIRGIVQGVGFRPFVFRIACREKLTGWVLNASDGVHIHAEGEEFALERFRSALEKQAPPASRIDSIESRKGVEKGFASFAIRESENSAAGEEKTLVSADIATCDECAAELFDAADRRYRYPFINCTNCGPRFTIIETLPYDRPRTSMKGFPMCDPCEAEYHDPGNRRFHAQPDACFSCGPHLTLFERNYGNDKAEPWIKADGIGREASDALIERTVTLLKTGHIVAIKGLGGYHLACDARDAGAVDTLRERKHRYGKPFAVMVRNLEVARRYCRLTDDESRLLLSPAHPIVLLERWGSERAASLATGVSGTLHELGVMLPYTPVQHLIFHDIDFPLVMTSGNVSEEPILTETSRAHKLLDGIADAFLDNDRPIVSRYDDSVARCIGSSVQMVRRARGYAPLPIDFADTPPSSCILATGPEQKSTFTLTRCGQAFVSQHIGDLENAETMEAWQETLRLYERLFDLKPTVIAYDLHPEYLSTKWATAPAQDAMPRFGVQHHHAHIASVLGENGREPREKVIGLAFDGTGYGDDGTIWGGEVLIAERAGATRFAHLDYLPLPGGAAAIAHPIRMAYASLFHYGLAEHPGAARLRAKLGSGTCRLIEQMIERGVNTPSTSSAGRLFDAVSALLGICEDAPFDGAAPMLLESRIYDPATGAPYPDHLTLPDGGGFALSKDEESGSDAYALSSRPLIAWMLDQIADGAVAHQDAQLARAFHDSFIAMLILVARKARAATGLSVVALSGGTFMNRYIVSRAVPALVEEGFEVLANRMLPPNDGCISYGQAVVAEARMAADGNMRPARR